MDSLLVVGTSVVGLAVGAALDPVGRRLADRSRDEEERRAEERRAEERRAEEPRAEEPHPVARAKRGAEAAEATEATEAVGGGERAAAPGRLRTSDGHGPSDGEGVPAAAGAASPPVEPGPARTVAAAAITALLFGGAAAEFGAHLLLVPFCVLFAMLVAVSATDLTHRLVPRRLVYAALVLIVPLLVLTSAVETSFSDLAGAAVAGAVSFAVFFALWWFVPRGMGFGDVRLAGAIGLTVGYLSLLHAYMAFLSGFVIGMIFGLISMAVSGTGRRTRIPFAPSLAAGAAIGVFWGAPLAHHLFHAG